MKTIPLTQGKEAIVDDEMYEYLTCWDWHYAGGYAKRNDWENGKGHILRMHHIVLPKKVGFEVDHVNGNSLDNRRVNLRYVTKKQNLRNQGVRGDNTSGFKGVSKFKKNRWRAYIVVNYKQVSLGVYDKKEEAALAYNKAAKEFHGEYARINKL